MLKLGKFLTVFALLVGLFGATAHAYVQFTATGANESGPEAVYANWQAFVTGEFTDQLIGLNCGGGTTSCTSAAGNNFVTVSPLALAPANFNAGVIQAENLFLDRSDQDVATFTWTLPTPAKAFAFFGFENDGGDITITFNDGTARMIQFMAFGGNDDNLFVGVADLDDFISSVTISTTDPGGFSNWDRFSVANVVPIPAALPLFLSALALFGIVARRRRSRRCYAGGEAIGSHIISSSFQPGHFFVHWWNDTV